MNISDEIRKQIEKNKGLKLEVGEINNHLSILEGLVRKDIEEQKNEAYHQGLEEGYERGLTEGKKAFDLLDAERDAEYQRGLEDAWEAARKIGHASQMKLKEMEFDFTDKDWYYNPSWDVVMNYTSSEAIAKLKAYEENQKADDEIKVGDEVIYNNTMKCLVVRPETDERYATLIDSNGNHHSAEHSECKKTGRHFDIASILKEMRS